MLNGISGYEGEVAEFICGVLRENSIGYEKDRLGNVIARQGENPDSVALFAHMDEVGLIVRGITGDGMLKFAPVGGIVTEILPSSRVAIGEKAEINGVIGNVPKHLKQKGGNGGPSVDDLFIDIGASSKKDALKYVKIGDPVYFPGGCVEFGDNLLKSKAVDDRAGVAALLSLLLKKKYSFTACFTTREEIGLVGAKSLMGSVVPQYALVLEVTTCADMPRDGQISTRMGGGPALTVMDGGSVSDPGFNAFIRLAAERNGIPLQYKLTVRGGNDARAVSCGGGGTRTAVLSLPGRYIHTPVSVISKDDYAAMAGLAEKILEGPWPPPEPS
jgi:endoglucanase